MQSFDKRYNHQCDIQFMIYSFFTCKSMVFTNKSLLCNWESCLVSQLYWLKGPCNRFQTHKRFKRFEVYKSDVLVLLFWKQNRWLSANRIIFPPGGENNLISSSILSELSHDWLPESGCQPASQTAPKQVMQFELGWWNLADPAMKSLWNTKQSIHPKTVELSTSFHTIKVV